MWLTKEWWIPQIGFKKIWGDLPLFSWLITICTQLLGDNPLFFRLPNAISGVFTLIMIYRMGKSLHGIRMGWLWLGSYLTSFLPHFFFRFINPIPLHHLLFFSALYYFYIGIHKKSEKNLLLCGFLTALNLLLAGSEALIIPIVVMVVIYTINRKMPPFKATQFTLILMGFCAPILIYCVFFLMQHSIEDLALSVFPNMSLMDRYHSYHGPIPSTHLWLIIAACFPMSLLAIAYFISNINEQRNKLFKKFMAITLWVILILFAFLPSKNWFYFNALALFPLSYFSGLYLNQIFLQKRTFPVWLYSSISLMAIIFGVGLYILPKLAEISGVLPLEDYPLIRQMFETLKFNGEQDGIIGLLYTAGILYGLYLMERKKITFAVEIIFFSIVLSIQFSLYRYLPVVEEAYQGPALRFIKAHKAEDCYILASGTNNASPLFYGQQQKSGPKSQSADWLLFGNIDKDLYIYIRKEQHFRVRGVRNLRLIYEENGFYFYHRPAVHQDPEKEKATSSPKP